MNPDLAELLTSADQHKSDEVLELYRDILSRECHDPGAPSPIEVWSAWEQTKVLWRLKRAGTDAQAVEDLVVKAPSHSSAARETWRMADDQTRLIQVGRANLQAIRSVRDELLQSAARRPGLVALKGGRSG